MAVVVLGLSLLVCPALAFASQTETGDAPLAGATYVKTAAASDLTKPYTSQPAGSIAVNGNNSAAIQAALDAARDQAAKTGKQAIVWVPNGSYNIDRGLVIYSNTALIAHQNAVLNKTFVDQKIYSALFEANASNNKLYGGINNVIINGGIWDGCDNKYNRKSTLISCRHSQNITFCNATFQNSKNHMLNISASRYVTVKNCTFKNMIRPSDMSASAIDCIEAIHMDFANEEGEPGNAISYDGTPAGDVVVTDCRFDNVFAGVGTHHTVAEGNKHAASKGQAKSWKYNGKSLTVSNCTFNNVSGHGIDAFSMDNVTITGCQATGSTKPEYFVRLEDAAGLQISNCGIISPIYATDYSKFTITGPCTINAAATNGISLDTGSTATISKVNITNSKSNAICLAGKAKANINNCIITGSRHYGVILQKTSGCTVQNNVIRNSGKSGIMVTNSTGANIVKQNYVINSKDHGITLAKAPKTTVTANISSSAKSVKSKYEIMVTKGSKGSKVTKNVLGSRKMGTAGAWSDPSNKVKIPANNVKKGPSVCAALATRHENAIRGTSSKLASVSAGCLYANAKALYVATQPYAKVKLKIGEESYTKKANKAGQATFKVKGSYAAGKKFKLTFTNSGQKATKTIKVSKAA